MRTKTNIYLIAAIILIGVVVGILYVLNTRSAVDEINKPSSSDETSLDGEDYADYRGRAFENIPENESGGAESLVPVVNESEREARDKYELELEALDN